MPKRKAAKPAAPQVPPATIVKTRADVARELKTRLGRGSVRSLADWFKMGCPNTPGAYNVDEIEAWVRDNVGSQETDDDQSDRAYWATFKLREQALKAQAERLLLEGAVVETSDVNRLIERLAATLTSMLAQWPDWILSLLPGDLPAKSRAKIRSAVATKVDELGEMVADALQEWAAASSTQSSKTQQP